jgi:ABC-type transport system involved in multi-copper enzyme maturation permease subunit
MPSMVMPLLRNELTKAVRTKLPYFGLLTASLICVLAYIVTKEANTENLNAWGFVSLSMQLVFTDIGLIFIAIFSAMLIAEETGFGTARMILSTPILRW